MTKPVYQTVNQERRYTVMKPVYETAMVEQPYTVCRPVTTVRQEVRECGYYERQYTMVPGPIVEQTGPRSRRGPVVRFVRAFQLLPPAAKVTATVAVQCPPRVVSQRVFVSRPVVRNVTETRYVRETMVRQVPVTTCRYVAEERVEIDPRHHLSSTSPRNASSRMRSAPAATCPRSASNRSPSPPAQYVAEERVEPYEVRTCEMVAEERVETIPVTTCSVRRRGTRRAL